MSKDIVVLTPNGRRQKILCTPDTSFLQILEEVCQKQGFQPTMYDLKHHNHTLDLTTTIRFSNIPNKALLEMVEADTKRKETNVTIGLLLENGDRRTGDFPPTTSLFKLITSLANTEFLELNNPTIIYMRQEVTGVQALKDKSLRQLGLISGRAILRLLNKSEESVQANVSAVYSRPIVQKDAAKGEPIEKMDIDSNSECSSSIDPHKEELSNAFIKRETLDPISILKKVTNEKPEKKEVSINEENISKSEPFNQESSDLMRTSTHSIISQESLERRLKIEEEVTFLGAQKAISFMQPDEMETEMEDLPDDFYELTVEEVRKLYHTLQQQRIELEHTPLVTSSLREQLNEQTSQQQLNTYKNVVVRVQFPDHIILQGIFSPTNTIEDINNFVKQHLKHPEKQFQIFTTPLKETVDPKKTLSEAKFVPCIHMHFKWIDDDIGNSFLKEECYTKATPSDAASILASKYRAPTRKKLENEEKAHNLNTASTSKNSKVPKWFKK